MGTKIILVRHGQTEWNRVERFRGQFDIPLNATGRGQAEKTALAIRARWKPTAVYASPLSRAAQTAEIIAQACGLLVQLLDGLTDIDYGKWQGLTPDEARAQWPEWVSDWFTQPEAVSIPGGDSLATVRMRALTTLDSLCKQRVDQDIVLVSHTVVNRLILLGALNLGNDRFWHIRQEPCAINVLEREGADYTIHSINCVSHLLS